MFSIASSSSPSHPQSWLNQIPQGLCSGWSLYLPQEPQTRRDPKHPTLVDCVLGGGDSQF